MVFNRNITHSFFVAHEAPNLVDFIKNHWLHSDGTISVKTWFSRIIYWIRDLIYDKTTRDIYTIFKRCATGYIEEVYNFRSLKTEGGPSLVDRVSPYGKGTSLACRFLKTIPRGKEKEMSSLVKAMASSMFFFKLAQFQNEETLAPPSKLSKESLKVAPPELELKLPIEQNDLAHQMDDLLGQFDLLFPEEARTEEDNIRRKSLKERLIEAVKRKDVKFLGVMSMDQPSAAFFEQLHHVLKNIAFELKQNHVSANRKREVLRRLGDCSKDCPPRWIEEAFQQYGSLTSQGINVRARVLKLVQNLKENMLYQDIQEKLHQIVPNSLIGRLNDPHLTEAVYGLGIHLLNKFRGGAEGLQFGLDQKRAQLDHNRRLTCWLGSLVIKGWDETFTSTYAQNVFDAHLKRELIVEQVRGQMLEEMESWPIRYQEVHSFLLSTVKSIHSHHNQGLPGGVTPEDYVANEYYDDAKYINAKGVNRVLRECGIN